MRVGKTGPLRFLSHHDMLRLLERAFRRANLPVRLTEGFNSRPRIVLPLPLEVGTESVDEPVEVELSEWQGIAEIRANIGRVLPEYIPLRAVKLLPPRRQSQPPVEAFYECRPPEAGVEINEERVAEFLAMESVPWKRHRPDGDVELDLRQGTISIEYVDGLLKMRLKTGAKSVRPVEILTWMSGDVSKAMLVPVKRMRTVLSPIEVGGRPIQKHRIKR